MLFMENKKDINVTASLRNVRGASIVIALSMIAAIMFFTIGMASTMIMAIQNTSDSKKAVQAEYAAQGGVELANFFLKDVEVGEWFDDDTRLVVLGSTPDTSVDYHVYGLDDSISTKYADSVNSRSVPIKGFGNAATSCSDTDDANSPCNWNKIYYGDSVEIPLYYIYDEQEPYTLNVEFDFRVRAPCNDGGNIASCTRYAIDAGQIDVVLNWQFSGESCKDSSCVVVPQLAPSNTSITGALIKDAVTNNNSIVLSHTSLCQDSVDPVKYIGSIYQFIHNTEKWAGNTLLKPKFKFSYVQKLDGLNDSNIPYLEYQLLYTGDPLAALNRVKIYGLSSGFKFNLDGVQGLGSGLFDFAVQN